MTGHGVETLAVSAGNEIGFVPTQTGDGKDVSVNILPHSSFS